MKAAFNRTGPERKELVMALSEVIGAPPVYKGVYSQAYQVGEIEVEKDGSIEFGELPIDKVKQILVELIRKGFKPVGFSSEKEPAPETTESAELEVSMPKDFFTDEAMTNLKRIVESKGKLMKAAFGVEELPILEKEDQVVFPWFKTTETGDGIAYSHFITAICEMAKNQTRVTAKEKETDNQKYAFRCFLLRLGFIGPEYKAERKILLKNLSGSSAFKNGAKEVTA